MTRSGVQSARIAAIRSWPQPASISASTSPRTTKQWLCGKRPAVLGWQQEEPGDDRLEKLVDGGHGV